MPEYFKPFFKVSRVQGVFNIEEDKAYIRSHPFKPNTVDKGVIQMLSTQWIDSQFFDYVTQTTDKYPAEDKKLSKEAYEDMGDLAILAEFRAAFTESPFRQRLLAASLAAYDAGNAKQLFSEISYIQKSRITMESANEKNSRWGYADVLANSCAQMWNSAIWQHVVPHIWQSMHAIIVASIRFNDMSLGTDAILWQQAKF